VSPLVIARHLPCIFRRLQGIRVNHLQTRRELRVTLGAVAARRRLWHRTQGLSASAAVSATTLAGCGRGRDGRGCGGLGGSPGRAARLRHGGGTDASREGHGSVTGLASREGDAGKVTLLCVLGNTHFRDARVDPTMVWSIRASRSRALIPGPKTDRRRTEPWNSRHLRERMRLPEALRDHTRTGRSRKRGMFPTWAGRRAIPAPRASGVPDRGRPAGAPAPRGSGVPDRAVPGGPETRPTRAIPPPKPSRPGRLIAVTASQDRDETPRTRT
jgi:hypothetical protein